MLWVLSFVDFATLETNGDVFLGLQSGKGCPGRPRTYTSGLRRLTLPPWLMMWLERLNSNLIWRFVVHKIYILSLLISPTDSLQLETPSRNDLESQEGAHDCAVRRVY